MSVNECLYVFKHTICTAGLIGDDFLLIVILRQGNYYYLLEIILTSFVFSAFLTLFTLFLFTVVCSFIKKILIILIIINKPKKTSYCFC